MNGILTEKIAVLRRIGWLARCPDDIRDALLDACRISRLDAGAPVFHINDPAGGLFGIESGCIAFEAAQSDRPPQMGLLLHPGCWFGEGTLSGRPTRLVGPRATRPTILAAVELKRFRTLAAGRPEIWRYVAELATENTARVIGLAEDLMLRGSRARLAAILVRLAGLRESSPPSPPVIDATQAEIAAVANLSRSMVSVLLHELERSGFIELGRSSISIADPSGLLRCAGSSSG